MKTWLCHLYIVIFVKEVKLAGVCLVTIDAQGYK